MPGHPLDPRAEGTNKLLKSGATLVTEAEDVLAALVPLTRDRPAHLREDPPPPRQSVAGMPAPASLSEDERGRVVAVLGPAPIDVDSVVRSTGLGIRSVQIALMELALAGRIERHGGGLVSLTSPEH